MGNPTADRFPVSVIVERRSVTNNRWITERWQVVGIVPGATAASATAARRLIHEDETAEQYLWGGFEIVLHRDETEGYYYNLLGRQPSVFVVCHRQAAELVPFLVLASHYEAEAYMDAGEEVFAIPLPPPIYLWLERYVVEHYVPTEKQGRKRDRWAGGDR